MMKTNLLALAAPFALAVQPAPALAQAPKNASPEASQQSEEEKVFASLMSAFAAEPLTAEQEARLPQATAIVDRMMPDGTMREMFGEMFDSYLGPIMSIAESSGPPLASKIGYSVEDLGITQQQAESIMAVIDPDWKERSRREMDVLQDVMSEAMGAMEPAMRRGMSEAYAVHFTNEELDGIQTFFETDIGTSFARKSFKIANDPRVMGAAMSELPRMMILFADIEPKLAAATVDLSEEKTYASLSPADRELILVLTGLSADDLEAGMAAAAQSEAEESDF